MSNGCANIVPAALDQQLRPVNCHPALAYSGQAPMRGATNFPLPRILKKPPWAWVLRKGLREARRQDVERGKNAFFILVGGFQTCTLQESRRCSHGGALARRATAALFQETSRCKSTLLVKGATCV